MNVGQSSHIMQYSIIALLPASCLEYLGGISLLTVPLTNYSNAKIVNCLFLKTTIDVRSLSAVQFVAFRNKQLCNYFSVMVAS